MPSRIGGRGRRVAAALIAGLAVGWMAWSRPPAPSDAGGRVHLDMLFPPGLELFTLSSAKLAISPDGSKVAYVAGGGGSRQIFVRSLDEPDSQPLRGTDAAFSTAFAPDGQSLVFLSRDRTLKRLSLRDGLLTDVATASGTNAPLWGADGFIIFGRDGLWRIAAAGGAPSRLTTSMPRAGKWRTRLATSCHPASCCSPVGPPPTVRSPTTKATRPESRPSIPPTASAGSLWIAHRRRFTPQRDTWCSCATTRFWRRRSMPRTAQVTGDAVVVIPAGVVRVSGGLPLLAPGRKRHAGIRADADGAGQPGASHQGRGDQSPDGHLAALYPAARLARWLTRWRWHRAPTRSGCTTCRGTPARR